MTTTHHFLGDDETLDRLRPSVAACLQDESGAPGLSLTDLAHQLGIGLSSLHERGRRRGVLPSIGRGVEHRLSPEQIRLLSMTRQQYRAYQLAQVRP